MQKTFNKYRTECIFISNDEKKLKKTKLSMMNMPKCNLRLLMLHELKLGKLPLELLPTSTEHGERDPQVYESSSENSVVEMRPLKMKKV